MKNAVVRTISKEKTTLLISYVITKSSPLNQLPYFSRDLHNYLAERLPSASVPNGVIVIDKFPLTPNGKINLNALPEVKDIKFA